MPGSPTTPGRAGTRVGAPVRVAFRHENSVGTRDSSSFAAQWLAYAYFPYAGILFARVHFVRVTAHHPPTLPSFAELESYLRQDWILDQQQQATAIKLAELRRKYRIVVPAGRAIVRGAVTGPPRLDHSDGKAE